MIAILSRQPPQPPNQSAKDDLSNARAGSDGIGAVYLPDGANPALVDVEGTVHQIMVFQDRIVKHFKDIGYIPGKFNIFIENDTGKITVIPSEEKASKITAAKLFHVLPKDDNHKFLEFC